MRGCVKQLVQQVSQLHPYINNSDLAETGHIQTLDVCSSSWSIHEKYYVSEAVKAVCVADPTEKVGKEVKKYVCEHPT